MRVPTQRQVAAVSWILLVLVTPTIVGCSAGGAGGGGSGDDGGGGGQGVGDYTTTVTDEGTVGQSVSYTADYYRVATPAQSGIERGDIPNVVEVHDELLVLDITSWPDGWQAGRIVAVRMPSGVVEYQRLIVRVQLSDGRLAIAIVTASLLEVFDSCELTIEGDLGETYDPAATAKLVTPIDFESETTIWLINDTSDTYLFDSHGVELKLTEKRLRVTPHVSVKLVIDRPSSPLDPVEDSLTQLRDAISSFLQGSGEELSSDPDGYVVVTTLQGAQGIADGLLTAKNVVDSVDSIVAFLSGDKSRIREGIASVEGEIVGTVRFSASASASYHDPFTPLTLAELMVPIGVAGPIPIFLEFELQGIGSVDFDGAVQVSSGVEITIPFFAGIRVLNGELVEVDQPDDEPAFIVSPPVFEGTHAVLELFAGVRCRAGISAATILSATVDPAAELHFDSEGSVTGDVTSGCVELDWELYGLLSAQLSAELDLKLQKWPYSWDLPLSYSIPLGGGPWETCWGEDNGEIDSDGDGVPDSTDGCPNDPNKSDPGDCGCGVPETPNCAPEDGGPDYFADAAAVAAGGDHTLVLKADGTVWAWGENGYGQLGDGTDSDSSFPVQVWGLTGVTAIAAGDTHSLAVKNDGAVWAWGENDYGKLGDGTKTGSYVPVRVAGLTAASGIAAGKYHSLAVRNDGTVWAWGNGWNGQLGDGEFGSEWRAHYVLSPIQVLDLDGASHVAAGLNHSLALKGNGTIWAWGHGNDGQLGDASATDRSVPVQVLDLEGVSALAAGYHHSLAIRNDGIAWAWGENEYGQLGDGTDRDSNVRVQVADLTDALAITGGRRHTVCLRNDGTVWTWGENRFGQLGDGMNTDRYLPAQLSSFTGVLGIAAGDWHSVALKNDGTLWAWGNNMDGQLGDGTNDDSNVPVQVLQPD